MKSAAAASKPAETATRLPLIEGILADLATVNLSEVQLPHRDLCSHFVVIGPAGDDLKRLLVLREAARQELNTFEGKAMGGKLSSIVGRLFGEQAELEGLHAVFGTPPSPEEVEAGKIVSRRYSVLGAMLADTYERTYPEHAARKLQVSHDGMVGYIDHSGLVEEAMRDMKAEIESGTFDFSPFPPDVVAALKAGEYDIEQVSETGFGLRLRKPAPAAAPAN